MKKELDLTQKMDGLLDSIRSIILKVRKNVAKSINSELLATYWEIGKLIVEVESNSKFDHKSSRQLILKLSSQLTKELGSGFSRANLFNMRKFFIEYPNAQTASGHLSWSHFNISKTICY